MQFNTIARATVCQEHSQWGSRGLMGKGPPEAFGEIVVKCRNTGPLPRNEARLLSGCEVGITHHD